MASPPPVALLAASHVLLLNASIDESEMYALWLQLCGYRVTVARDLAAARQVARREAVDVLVVDAFYGASFHHDDFEVQWTRLTHTDSLALVVLSGYLGDGQPMAAHGLRKICVFKPCLPRQLSDAVEDLLSTAQVGRASKGNYVGGYPLS